MTDQYAVIGHPINHSKSPVIHHAFAEQTGEDLHYSAIELPLEGLADQLIRLRDEQYIKGLNVTVPFKEQAWQISTQRTERGQLAGAINTITFSDDGQIIGDNTDGIGLCQDIQHNHHFPLQNKRILLLGAGGASRGVILPLLSHQPSHLFIANRTASKATDLANTFSTFGDIAGGGIEHIQGPFDLIINATAASLQGQALALSADILHEHSFCYDMMYSAQDTVFIEWAKQHHITKTADGLGMLVEQAAEAFFIWRGKRPETQPVIQRLRYT